MSAPGVYRVTYCVEEEDGSPSDCYRGTDEINAMDANSAARICCDRHLHGHAFRWRDLAALDAALVSPEGALVRKWALRSGGVRLRAERIGDPPQRRPRGRRPLPDGQARVLLHARVSADAQARLAAEAKRAGEPIGRTIDRLAHSLPADQK